MSLFKRMVMVLLAITLLVSSLCVFAQETEEITEATMVTLDTTEFDALYTLGMLGDDFASLGKNETVTRAQFVGSLFNIAGYSAMSYRLEELPFIDVSIENPYKDAIFTLYKMGLVNGTSLNTFSPDEPVNYLQAVKFIINVCGYGEFTAKRYGSDLNGYLAMAQYLKISRGTAIDDPGVPLEAWKTVKLLYNAARTKVMEPTAYVGDGTVYYDATNSKELISSLNDIYYNEGIMTSNGIISLHESKTNELFAKIGNTEYYVGGLDLTQMLGCSVKCFYKQDNERKTLQWVGVSDDNTLLKIDSYDLEVDHYRYTMQCVVYNEDDRLSFAEISPYATIVYNNALYNDAGVEQLKPEMGSIKFIDNDNDEVYDIVIIEEYENVFTTSFITSMNLIGSKYSPAIDLEEYEYVKIYKDGKECDKEDIKINSVISVVGDRNKKFLFLYLSDEAIQGKLISISEKDGMVTYELDLGTYQVSSGFENRDTTRYTKIDPVLGRTYQFYLDKDGKIAEIADVDNGVIDYAYLIDAAPDNTLFAKDSAVLKLLLRDGTVTVATTREKLTLNGIANKTGKDILAYPGLYDGTGKVAEQVIRVSFDGNGLIKEFEFAIDNIGSTYGYDPENFSLDFSGAGGGVWSINGVLTLDKYVLDASVTVFVKYVDDGFEDTYGVITGKSVSQGSRVLNLYDIRADQRITVASVTLSRKSSLGSEFLVSDVFYKCIDEEIVKCLGGYYGGTYLEYAELNRGIIPDSIKRGDVVDISLYNQRIIEIKKFLSLADNPRPIGTGTYLSNYRMFSHVYTASNIGITMISPDGFAANYGKILPVAFQTPYSIPVTIYDVKNDKIYKGSVYDLTSTTQPDKNGELVIDDNTVMAVIQYVNRRLVDVIYVKY